MMSGGIVPFCAICSGAPARHVLPVEGLSYTEVAAQAGSLISRDSSA